MFAMSQQGTVAKMGTTMNAGADDVMGIKCSIWEYVHE
jgi:hypothetical protein